MLLLAHLLAGIVIGIVLASLFRYALLIPACALGSVIPDLIDKPLGIIILAESIGYGRIYCHTLLLFSLIMLSAVLLSVKYPRPALIVVAFATGIFSHQALDAMWNEPANWFWPLFGSFQGRSIPDYFAWAISTELGSPTEWLAGIFILVFFILWFIPGFQQKFIAGPIEQGAKRHPVSMALFLAALVVLTGMVILYYWL